MINIVIPMAGLGSRFAQKGYEKPKPFIDVAGKPMIVRVLENLSFKGARYILLARKEHIEQESHLVSYIQDKFNATFITIDHLTEGTACTILHARKYVDNNTPLLIANSDQIVDIDISNFIEDCHDRGLDGSILTFSDDSKNPKWSFAKTDSTGLVLEVREKVAISNLATVGIYMYSQGKMFVDSAIDMIVRNDRVNNEFYTCPAYNYAVKNGLKIGVYNIELEQMHGIGTPEDLDIFINNLN